MRTSYLKLLWRFLFLYLNMHALLLLFVALIHKQLCRHTMIWLWYPILDALRFNFVYRAGVVRVKLSDLYLFLLFFWTDCNNFSLPCLGLCLVWNMVVHGWLLALGSLRLASNILVHLWLFTFGFSAILIILDKHFSAHLGPVGKKKLLNKLGQIFCEIPLILKLTLLSKEDQFERGWSSNAY